MSCCAQRLLGLSVCALLVACGDAEEPEFLTSVPWSFSDTYLLVDTHTHTTFSDGSLTPEELLALASKHGCDGIAITDHSDAEATASEAYFAAIDAARARFPRLITVAGLEWNIPPYGGREHLIVLTDPSVERELNEFRSRYEEDQTTAADGLMWLHRRQERPYDVLGLYAHPSRKDATAQENFDDMIRWRAANDVVIGFEGAPGHQRAEALGSYKGAIKTIHGWDPVVAEVGGVWDRLLDEGHDVWAASAPSDYHNDRLDYPPCAFSRTHVQVAERSQQGMLAGLKAGSFWADHGKLLASLDFHVTAADLIVPASPGESFYLANAGALTVTVGLRTVVDDKSSLRVELIGNGRGGTAEILSSQQVSGPTATVEEVFSEFQTGADGRSIFFRVRIRQQDESGRELAAYSNPIRVFLNRPLGDH